LEITGGNAEGAENKEIAKKATRKLMEGKTLEIDGGTKTCFADLRPELWAEIADGVGAKRLSGRGGYFM
jgi:hypothetical protein